MQSKAKTLRHYQEKLVFNVSRATGDVLVEQPTGSGKTVQIVTLVAMHLGKRFTHAVISAPQEQIEQGFVKRDYNSVAFPQRHGVAVPSIQVPKQTILGARDSKVGSVKRVIQYLRQPGPLDHAFACTHAALNRLIPDDLPADLTGKALFIDEAHHASADGLSQIVTLWRERGGQLFFFTATPYRGDGRPVKLDGMRTYRRSLAEHMAEGFAPKHLESEIVALGKPGDAITAAQFTGEEAPPASYFDSLVGAICRRWRDDGRPKAIVRVPPMQGGKSGELVRRLTQALAAENARVLDATGTGTSDKLRFLAALKAEQQHTFATSTFDVMIGIQRVLEGTDWPLCSAVYCVDMPGSLNTVVQFLGRAMRLKGPDYPADQRDRAKLVFFVPCGGGSALADLSIDHSRHALLTCCFLADHEVGQEWIVLREVRRGIEAALGLPLLPPGEGPTFSPLPLGELHHDRTTNWPGQDSGPIQDAPEENWANINAALRIGLRTLPGDSSLAQLLSEYRDARNHLALPNLTIEGILAWADTYHQRTGDWPNSDSGLIEGSAYESWSGVNAALNNGCRGLPGGSTIRKLLAKERGIRNAKRPPPLKVDEVLEWADAHYQRTGEWPKKETGEIPEAPGKTWNAVTIALKRGQRGLPADCTLAQLLEKERGARNLRMPPKLTIDQILAWADAHHLRTEEWPKGKAGAIEEAAGETWTGIDQALQKGRRGFTGGSSLAQVLAEHRSVRNQAKLEPLSNEMVVAWAKMHYQRTGRWPTHKDGAVIDALEEKWANIQQALQKGLRGLPGGSSLTRLIKEYLKTYGEPKHASS